MKLGEAMYAAQKPGDDTGDGAAPGGSTESQDKEDVVDAEFTDVDDDKKKSA